MQAAQGYKMLVSLMLAIMCASCGGGGDGATSNAAMPSPTAIASAAVAGVGAVSPLPTSTPATATPLSNMSQLSAIASNFDVASWLVKGDPVPPSAAPDVVGAFRFICQAAHLGCDDPIIYPGQPGKSHLHQFFGNTRTDANSTFASLRETGDSTCMGPLNRSAYWIPAMMNGKGSVIRPDYVAIYYKRRPASDPKCDPTKDAQAQGKCVDLPRGLRFVFGYNMQNPAQSPTGAAYFNCDGPTGTQGHYPNMVAAAAKCPAGNRLGAIISAPDCWDGKNLDSPDHRSHMAYAGYGDWGYFKCPATHPFVVPAFSLGAWYGTDATLPNWYLSSDRMPGMADAIPGTTLHSDWWGAWDDPTMDAWTANCIDKMLNCSDGQLGDGTILKRPANFAYLATPRVVAVPSRL